MREAILAELGLMPMWQLRPTQMVDAPVYTAMSLQSDDGKLGWLLLSEALTAETEQLLMNILAACQLTALSAPQQLSADMLSIDDTWLWLAGVQAVSGMVENKALFMSVSLPYLLAHPAYKAMLWTDWCAYKFRDAPI
jgi:DNA polymerase III psi subunit